MRRTSARIFFRFSRACAARGPGQLERVGRVLEHAVEQSAGGTPIDQREPARHDGTRLRQHGQRRRHRAALSPSTGAVQATRRCAAQAPQGRGPRGARTRERRNAAARRSDAGSAKQPAGPPRRPSPRRRRRTRAPCRRSVGMPAASSAASNSWWPSRERKRIAMSPGRTARGTPVCRSRTFPTASRRAISPATARADPADRRRRRGRARARLPPSPRPPGTDRGRRSANASARPGAPWVPRASQSSFVNASSAGTARKLLRIAAPDRLAVAAELRNPAGRARSTPTSASRNP